MMNQFILMTMSPEFGSLMFGLIWSTVMYRATKHWANLVMMFLRAENSRKTYWFCQSNEHHGYLKPAELQALKAEGEVNVQNNLSIATAFVAGWAVVGIMGAICFANL